MSHFNILATALLALSLAAGVVLVAGLQAAAADLLPPARSEAS